MIRHCVFLRFKDGISADAQQAILQKIANLQAVCTGMLCCYFGPNVSDEGFGKGFDHGFMIDFDSVASRDNYLIHPAHQVLGSELVSMLEGGVDGLVVFDLTV